jgi:hypothetical protein
VVSVSIPGIRYTTSVNLEPIHAPKQAHAMVRQVVRAIALSCRGVVLDSQEK